ncbi:unnamed protein product [Aphanomyces euteiches]|uniref:Uncharacterized protein n=1 Tax=Aphanomyces euteiches TaxID=100861 RepID=A0A6G0XNL7_9STRA|nr:hypothetical protein Ae201684_003041 [Aphanomyces euteiches]KAH9098479.1 hypothetical protein Ae201684P_017691 [Aphanomyces euteiches]KAH9123555.1 hypothetical protein AeMF1_005478 [Aphanomyces euteiches]KAH9134906.1 hypothetical protein AeRB84_019411 [Aphanomyces euteiches]
MHQVFAQLPSYNPFVGSFHHAPSAGNRGAVYFASDIVFASELEMRKKLRQNPFAGTFHALPGYYDPLHGLQKFRKAKNDSLMTSNLLYVQVEYPIQPNHLHHGGSSSSARPRAHSDSDMPSALVSKAKHSRGSRRSSLADAKPKRVRSRSHFHKPHHSASP